MTLNKKSLLIAIAVLSICLSFSQFSQAFAATAQQPQQPEQTFKVRFSGIASGKALILPNWLPGDTEPQSVVMGRGRAFIVGVAAASGPYDPNGNVPDRYYYADNSVSARGCVSARWRGHAIEAVLIPRSKADGIFVDKSEGNIFMVGIFPGADSILFRARYTDQTGTRMISGRAGAFVMQLGDTGVIGLAVTFFNPDSTPLLTVIWAQNTVVTPFGQTLPAANTFARCVRII